MVIYSRNRKELIIAIYPSVESHDINVCLEKRLLAEVELLILVIKSFCCSITQENHTEQANYTQCVPWQWHFYNYAKVFRKTNACICTSGLGRYTMLIQIMQTFHSPYCTHQLNIYLTLYGIGSFLVICMGASCAGEEIKAQNAWRWRWWKHDSLGQVLTGGILVKFTSGSVLASTRAMFNIMWHVFLPNSFLFSSNKQMSFSFAIFLYMKTDLWLGNRVRILVYLFWAATGPCCIKEKRENSKKSIF